MPLFQNRLVYAMHSGRTYCIIFYINPFFSVVEVHSICMPFFVFPTIYPGKEAVSFPQLALTSCSTFNPLTSVCWRVSSTLTEMSHWLSNTVIVSHINPPLIHLILLYIVKLATYNTCSLYICAFTHTHTAVHVQADLTMNLAIQYTAVGKYSGYGSCYCLAQFVTSVNYGQGNRGIHWGVW